MEKFGVGKLGMDWLGKKEVKGNDIGFLWKRIR